MKIAVISDVHANIWALEKTLDYLQEKTKPDETWFLGDLFGYGPKPYSSFMKFYENPPARWLAGNHDLAVGGSNDLMGSGINSRQSDEIHKNCLADFMKKQVAEKPRWDYFKEHHIYLSHALPELGAHVTSSLVQYDSNFAPNLNERPGLLERRQQINPEIRIFLAGHSHRQTGWFWNGETWRLVVDGFGQDLEGKVLPDPTHSQKASFSLKDWGENDLLYLNPGSIGFPRDGIRSESALLAKFLIMDLSDEEIQVEFCSVPYMEHYEEEKIISKEWDEMGYPASLLDLLK